MRTLLYKNWKIQIEYNQKDNKSVFLFIKNEELNITFSLERKCYKVISNCSTKVKSKLFGYKEKVTQDINYLELETMNDLLEEAKQIVDGFELIRKKTMDDKICKEMIKYENY